MKVYLDDERQTPPGFTRVYWPEEAIDLLKTGQVDEISLDHDLGDDEHGTGYDVVKWIEEEVFLNGFVPPEMNVHSANSSAAAKMWAGIESIERFHERNLRKHEGIQLLRELISEIAVGIHGAGMTSDELFDRLGYGSIHLEKGGEVTEHEADQVARQIARIKPERIFAYSRGAAALNAALYDPDMSNPPPPITYLAPAMFRGWSRMRPKKVPPGSMVLHGAKDKVVSVREAAQIAIAIGAPLYLSLDYSHKSIMYSKGDPSKFTQVDPYEIAKSKDFPQWGRGNATQKLLSQQIIAVQNLLGRV